MYGLPIAPNWNGVRPPEHPMGRRSPGPDLRRMFYSAELGGFKGKSDLTFLKKSPFVPGPSPFGQLALGLGTQLRRIAMPGKPAGHGGTWPGNGSYTDELVVLACFATLNRPSDPNGSLTRGLHRL